ncbi:hypothetical protein [Amnibacterium sp.]|uniref:hypothetical protein n=1 Tax=Amnibacterium sp. TaxID=1872496 RepID=UPI003F7BDCCA
MRDGGSEGWDGPPATTDRVADERGLDTPNCGVCLTRMEAVESRGGEPYWSCPACGTAALA